MIKSDTRTQEDAYKDLRYAIVCKNPDKAIPIILAYPTILNTVDKYNTSLLQTALSHFEREIVKALLLQKINVNHRNSHGLTALTSALVKANYEMVRLLLQAGAELDENHLRDKQAKKLAINKNPAIAELLEEAERHELEPLSPLSLSQTSSSEEEIGGPRKSTANNEPHLSTTPLSTSQTNLTSSLVKQDSTTTSWHDTLASLRRRFIPDSQKVAHAITTIEMSHKGAAPSPAAPTKYSHID